MIERRNPLRAAAASAAAPAEPLLAMGCVGTLVAAAFATAGMPRSAGIVLACSATALLFAVAAPSPKGAFATYVRDVTDGIADAIVLTAVAWPLRAGPMRIGAAAVAAVGLVLVGAYAQTRAASLGYRVPAVVDGSPERALVLAAGMVLPSVLETALWAIAAAGAAAAARVAVTVWMHRE